MTVDAIAIPPPMVARFIGSLAALVAALDAAATEAAGRPELAGSPALRAWQAKALPLLRRHAELAETARAYFLIGEAGPILTLAQDKRGLAKDLDGFPLDFAGPEQAGKIEPLVTAVVTSAWQLCAVGGVP